jgi:aspartate aminotransferase
MSVPLSHLVRAVRGSDTLAMAAKARQLKDEGRTIYDLSLGEPDFNTPVHICEAAARAMDDGRTHYTAVTGILELRKAIARQYHQTHGLEYSPAEVVVSNGAKHALANVLAALLDPGDEAIIPAPYWVSYGALVELSGAVPVIVDTDEADDFKLRPEQLRRAITEKTKLLILCSPSNPTGCMYSGEELGSLADVVLEHDLAVVADEIYERLAYPGHRFVSFATLRPGLGERTMLINGVSKAYAMTGWRIGWSMTPPDVAKAIGNLQSQQTSCPSSVSQYAALAAIDGPQQCVAEMLAEFTHRREFVRRRIQQIPGLSCPEMGGAFYAFMNIKQHLGRQYGGVQVDNSIQWCLELLSQKNVATVMGSAFGCEGYARASFATSMTNLERAFERIEEFVSGK